jgi:hypothetical protein
MGVSIVAAIFVGMLLASPAAAQEAEEYQVKAAFLYNFAKFVEWPSQAFKGPQDPVLVCVLGRNPFGSALEQAIHGKSVQGRPFNLRQVNGAEQANGCQILFISSSEARHFRSFWGSLNPAGILTVGEVEGFAANGGVINFKLDLGRVRFEINLDAAERAQLQISSKLLNLAQIVKTDKARSGQSLLRQPPP